MMSETVTSKIGTSETEPAHYLFWMVLVFGIISGVSSYFILTLNESLTWYIIGPILYAISYACMYVLISYQSKNESQDVSRNQFRHCLKYSGSWILVFFVFGTIMYHFGW